MVEFALVFPLLFGVMLAVFELGRLMAVDAQIINGVSAGARAGIVKSNSESDIKDRVVAQANFADATSLRSGITVAVDGTTCSGACTRTSGQQVSVSASYQHSLIPAMGNLLKRSFTSITLTHTVAMTVE
jgi:Flp pilus assembly protein TadG